MNAIFHNFKSKDAMWFQLVRYNPSKITSETKLLGLNKVSVFSEIEIWIQAYIDNVGLIYDLSKYKYIVP